MKFGQHEILFSLPRHSEIAQLVREYLYLHLELYLLANGLVIILVVTFLHNVAFNAGTFYLALFYQVNISLRPFLLLLKPEQAVNETTPLEAGMMLLPYSLGASLASMPAAWFIGFWQKRSKDTSGQRWVICVGLAVAAVGFGASMVPCHTGASSVLKYKAGLLILLHEQSPTVLQIMCPLVAGVGLGMLFHAPYQIFIRALKPREIATGTSAFFLVRFTGATIGLVCRQPRRYRRSLNLLQAVAGAIFYARLSQWLPLEYPVQGSSSIDLKLLSSIQPLKLKLEVLHVIASSIQVCVVRNSCRGLQLI
jgi:hypothetical protein